MRIWRTTFKYLVEIYLIKLYLFNLTYFVSESIDFDQLLLQKKKMKMMIEERDRYNNTALHLASMKGHTDTVKV